jgi:hypothetical protein
MILVTRILFTERRSDCAPKRFLEVYRSHLAAPEMWLQHL